MSNFQVKRGDIFMAELPEAAGSQQYGLRPVLVVSNDKGNTYAPILTVTPITGASKRPMPTHLILPAGAGGLQQTSTALFEQIQTIDKSLIRKKVGTLEEKFDEKIDECIMNALGVFGRFCDGPKDKVKKETA